MRTITVTAADEQGVVLDTAIIIVPDSLRHLDIVEGDEQEGEYALLAVLDITKP